MFMKARLPEIYLIIYLEYFNGISYYSNVVKSSKINWKVGFFPILQWKINHCIKIISYFNCYGKASFL